MENQQQQNGSPRGRGRGRGTRRNFGSRSVERAEARKTEDKEEQISQKANQQPKVVDKEKTAGLIEKGKAWLNKHFNGMTKSERGNVRVTLNPRVDFELYSLYESRLRRIISNQIMYDDDTRKEATYMLRPLIGTMIGIKLLKANTQFGKANMISYKGISDIDFKVPGNLANIIECFGKSDAINDNVIRIVAQNNYIQQKFLYAIIDFVASNGSFGTSNYRFASTVKDTDVQEFKERHIDKESNLRLYTVDARGIEMINSLGKEAAQYLNDTDLWLNEDKKNEEEPILARLPYFDFNEAKNIGYILRWEHKIRKFFTLVKYDYKAYQTTLGLALIAWMPLRFIDKRKEKMATIDKRFEGTAFANITPDSVLTQLDMYPLDVMMSEEQLVANVITLLGEYRSKYEKVFDLAFNMKEFKPTEYGTSAQIVEGHRMDYTYLDDANYYGGMAPVVVDKFRPHSHLKMRDDEALMGTIFKFNRKVEISSNYEINYSNSTSQIRLDYVVKDFK